MSSKQCLTTHSVDTLPMQTMSGALVSVRVLVEIQLMIILSIPPLPSRHDFCDYFLPDRSKMFRLNVLGDTLGNYFLLGIMSENGRAIFFRLLDKTFTFTLWKMLLTRADVSSLPIDGGRIVRAVEKLCIGSLSARRTEHSMQRSSHRQDQHKKQW